jgi:hypothetical protein
MRLNSGGLQRSEPDPPALASERMMAADFQQRFQVTR